jgi:hypothetical protein
MEEKELISKIKGLKDIKPNKDWAVFVKAEILGKEPKANWISVLEFFPGLIYKHSRLAFATLIVFGIVAGTFGFAQGALPGDPIYALKRATEKAQLAFVSEKNLPNAQIGLANKRLEELNVIAKTNQSGKLAPAIQEFQANVSRAAKDLAKSQNPDIGKIVLETKKLKENKQKVESLGVVVGEIKDLDDALAQLVGKELKDIGSRTLTDGQKEILLEAGQEYWAGNYSESLEKILLLGN